VGLSLPDVHSVIAFDPVLGGARGGAVDWGNTLQTGRWRVRFPIVIGIFHWHNRSGRTMVLWSTQPPTDMSTRNISWGLRRLTRRADNLPPSCADCFEIWKPQPSGTLWACSGLYRDFFTFSFTFASSWQFSEFVTLSHVKVVTSNGKPDEETWTRETKHWLPLS
jgi:hypothetical protein